MARSPKVGGVADTRARGERRKIEVVASDSQRFESREICEYSRADVDFENQERFSAYGFRAKKNRKGFGYFRGVIVGWLRRKKNAAVNAQLQPHGVYAHTHTAYAADFVVYGKQHSLPVVQAHKLDNQHKIPLFRGDNRLHTADNFVQGMQLRADISGIRFLPADKIPAPRKTDNRL